jgi:hypothetical protein
MHVQDLGLFMVLVQWILWFISNQTLEGLAKRHGLRWRRALFGVRLRYVSAYSNGVKATRRRWDDGIMQTQFSAKDIRSALHVLAAGIGFDSLVVARSEDRKVIFEALDCACNIIYLQRLEVMTTTHVDECRAASNKLAEILRSTDNTLGSKGFSKFRPSELDFPKWLFARLIFDDFLRHGCPQAIGEDQKERDNKRHLAITRDSTNKKGDFLTQIHARLAASL